MKKDEAQKQPDSNAGSAMDQKPQPFEIPADGCLGLLALGYHGLELWREVRDKQETGEDAKGG